MPAVLAGSWRSPVRLRVGRSCAPSSRFPANQTKTPRETSSAYRLRPERRSARTPVERAGKSTPRIRLFWRAVAGTRYHGQGLLLRGGDRDRLGLRMGVDGAASYTKDLARWSASCGTPWRPHCVTGEPWASADGNRTTYAAGLTRSGRHHRIQDVRHPGSPVEHGEEPDRLPGQVTAPVPGIPRPQEPLPSTEFEDAAITEFHRKGTFRAAGPGTGRRARLTT
jgi:hypothetical protein